jgi:SnoaL-like domain
MSDVTTTVDTYLAMWNETDPARRAEHIRAAWAEDGTYVDPQLEAAGHQALDTMVAAVHERFPGSRFRRLSAVDAHHRQLRFAWELAAPDGGVVVAGIDVGELAPDGRLRSITGFFGELAEAEAAA